MKYLYSAALLLTISLFGNAQTVVTNDSVTGVEKSLFNIQTGFIGLWVSHEARLNNAIALKSEIGLDAGYFVGYQTNNKSVFMAGPSINLEPRWYYNMESRAAKGRNTANNASNFVGVSFKYLPDWFTLSNTDNYNIADQIIILPKWSIRHNLGRSNFNYEAGAGVGYQYTFLKQYGFRNNPSDIYVDFHLRFGYTFK